MSELPPLSPEVLIPRLGDFLVEKKLITSDQLEIALLRQQELRKKSKAPLLGELLIEMGFVNRQALNTAITEQILSLRNALEESNRMLERRVQLRTAELEKALNKLSELNQMKANFVANISHELRTPLTHVKGYLELLINGDLGHIAAEQHKALEIMSGSTERLENLINDLIRFTDMERGQVTLTFKAIDLQNLLQHVYRQSLDNAHDHKVELKLVPSPEKLQVLVDEQQITWVLAELVENGVKFTPAGGHVKIGYEIQNNLAYIYVKDDGIGISHENQEKLFTPFHQLDGSSTRKYGGIGLGLALAQRIIEAHGSAIEVISEEGKGSEFAFLLKT
ncbi:MAG TPA: ATP-binding protein, partial [Longilinea sp.]|nr:ATP-binding protein [Longilinea sp.]